MKNAIFLFIAFILSLKTMGQAPQGFNYQAIIKNSAGELMANQNLSLRLCVRQGSANGAITYQEIKSLSTNDQGLVATVIGSGPATIGTFSNLDWSQGPKYLQVDLNFGQGWLLYGIEPFQSVPFALYAETTSVSVSQTGDTLQIGQNNIIIPGVSAANHIFGCTNSAACNFNPLATDNDGSCHITGQSCDDGDAATTNDQYNAQCVCAGTVSYSIGSQGPAGGYVFYDKGSYSNGWRYLEVYPTSFFGIWGCQGTLVAGITNTIGAGDINTAAILAACSSTDAVARIIDNYSVNGFNDWYLPNNAEMNLICDNLYTPNIGNIPGPFHWTSSQQNATYGAVYDFEFDFNDIQAKNVNISGVPVRKF
jgi:hypothetical protein